MSEYNRLYNSLRNQILGGHYAAGQKLPPERLLCKDFGVSRITARHAIRLLQEQGLVERFQGRGTYVRNIKPQKVSIVNCNFSNSILKNASHLKRKLISCQKVSPPPSITEYLNLNKNDECLLAKRLDIINDEPAAYDRAFIPIKYSSSINDKMLIKIDFFELWAEAENLNISYGTESIEAIGANSEAVEILKVKPDSPILLTVETSYDSNGNALAVFESVYRGDIIKLTSTNYRGDKNVKITN
ncbi:MAG: GntR family transcriptional regulator [Phycisphaerae bacterium]|jgi:GntR family transcriptional regulator